MLEFTVPLKGDKMIFFRKKVVLVFLLQVANSGALIFLQLRTTSLSTLYTIISSFTTTS